MNGGPSVTIVRSGQSAPFMSGAPKRRRSSAGGERFYAWVVVSLLGASTALSLYDAYVLFTFTAGG
jgi:hypothetical protein